jgi:hypothetical protein
VFVTLFFIFILAILNDSLKANTVAIIPELTLPQTESDIKPFINK